MDTSTLNWLTPLHGFMPKARGAKAKRGRPRKVNPVVEMRIRELHSHGYPIYQIADKLKLNRDTVAHYLGRQKRGG